MNYLSFENCRFLYVHSFLAWMIPSSNSKSSATETEESDKFLIPGASMIFDNIEFETERENLRAGLVTLSTCPKTLAHSLEDTRVNWRVAEMTIKHDTDAKAVLKDMNWVEITPAATATLTITRSMVMSEQIDELGM
mmetsp:Transcript_7872/g.14177  ORF Transcript_7872/g.14177 Transcript_7872/m.14177 type:complete len:137 (+) Transcript_7872:199-609(+)